MTAKTLFIVQQFERKGRKLVASRGVEFQTLHEAKARARRDAFQAVGVVALSMTVDINTGSVLEKPRVLARYGDVGKESAA